VQGTGALTTHPEKAWAKLLAGVGGCRKGDVIIGIGEDCRDRSA
jgi:hypothetical protein